MNKLFDKVKLFIQKTGLVSLLHLAIGVAFWIMGWTDAFMVLLGWFLCRNWNLFVEVWKTKIKPKF